MDKDELRELMELSRENNKMLRSMQRTAMFYRVVRVIYWSLVIGSIFGAYYYVQPYVDRAIEVYNQLRAEPTSTGSPTDLLGRLDSLIKK